MRPRLLLLALLACGAAGVAAVTSGCQQARPVAAPVATIVWKNLSTYAWTVELRAPEGETTYAWTLAAGDRQTVRVPAGLYVVTHQAATDGRTLTSTATVALEGHVYEWPLLTLLSANVDLTP